MKNTDANFYLSQLEHSMKHDIDRYNELKNDTKSSYVSEFCKGKIEQSIRVIELINKYKMDILKN